MLQTEAILVYLRDLTTFDNENVQLTCSESVKSDALISIYSKSILPILDTQLSQLYRPPHSLQEIIFLGELKNEINITFY